MHRVFNMSADDTTSESALDRTFRISIALKGLDGVLEVIGAIVFCSCRPPDCKAGPRP
jgi:hypothetical protein